MSAHGHSLLPVTTATTQCPYEQESDDDEDDEDEGEDDCESAWIERDDDEFYRHERFCCSTSSRHKRQKHGSSSFCLFFPSLLAPPSREGYNVNDICRLARAGDIVLMDGEGMSSMLVRFFTPARNSHAALVVELVDEVTKQMTPGLVEAVRHTDDVADIQGRYVAGVRVVPLRQRINTYHGYSISIRHLTCARGYSKQKIRGYLRTHLKAFVDEYMGRGYNHDWRAFLNARVPLFRNTSFGARYDRRDPNREFFCSELVAQALIEMNLLDGQAASASAYSPDSFSDAADLQIRTPFELMGADLRYEDEVFIDLSTRPSAHRKASHR